MPVEAAPGKSLDFYRLCDTPGCWYQVHIPATKCRDHGGAPGNQEYAQSDDGDLLDWRGFPALECD